MRDKFSIGLQDNQDRAVIALRILRCIEFTTARRMMSVVVSTKDDSIFVFTKGSDTALIPLIEKTQLNKRGGKCVFLRTIINTTNFETCLGSLILI